MKCQPLETKGQAGKPASAADPALEL